MLHVDMGNPQISQEDLFHPHYHISEFDGNHSWRVLQVQPVSGVVFVCCNEMLYRGWACKQGWGALAVKRLCDSAYAQVPSFVEPFPHNQSVA